MQSRSRVGITILLFCAALFFYRGLIYGTFQDDLHDYQQFMEQRIVTQTDADFFWRVVSFDRVREQDSRVNFLFRPGLFGFLALEDIYFRADPRVGGVISMVLHALVVASLFLLLARFTSLGVAALLSFLFAFYAHGAFMITWRMIVPYTIGLLAFAWGCVAIRWGKYVGAGLLFFLSSLFHENAAFWLLFAGVVLFFWKQRFKERRALLLALIIPSLCYFALNAADLTLRGASGGLFSDYFAPFSGGPPRWFIFVGLFVLRFFQAIGCYSLPLFVPQTASFPWSISQPVFFLAGAAVIGIAIRFLRKYWVALRAGERDSVFWTLFVGYPIFLFGLLAFFRIAPRGYFYLGASSYYRYIAAFFLVVCVGAIWKGLPQKLWQRGLLLALLINYVAFNVIRQEKTMAQEREIQRPHTEALIGVEMAMRKDLECFVWDDSYRRSTELVPPIYLYRRTCGVIEGRPTSWDEIKRKYHLVR